MGSPPICMSSIKRSTLRWQWTSSNPILIRKRPSWTPLWPWTSRGYFTQPRSWRGSQLSGWHRGDDPPRQAKVVGSGKKMMLTACFNSKGMIWLDVLAQGPHHQLHLLDGGPVQDFWPILGRKRLEKNFQGWLLQLRQCTATHVSKATIYFIAKHGIKRLDHSPHSSNLAPCNFWLFPSWRPCSL